MCHCKVFIDQIYGHRSIASKKPETHNDWLPKDSRWHMTLDRGVVPATSYVISKWYPLHTVYLKSIHTPTLCYRTFFFNKNNNLLILSESSIRLEFREIDIKMDEMLCGFGYYNSYCIVAIVVVFSCLVLAWLYY